MVRARRGGELRRQGRQSRRLNVEGRATRDIATVIYRELVAESALRLLGFGCKKDPKFPFPGTRKLTVSR